MNIILLRHAETVSNAKSRADSQIESALSSKGLSQAQALPMILKGKKIDLFVVSPLKRNLDTLQPFLLTLKNPIVVTSELTLERNLGKFTGTPLGTFQHYCDEHGHDRIFYRPEGGESIADVYERAKRFLEGLKKQHAHETVLVCGHKNFLLCLELAILKIPVSNFSQSIPLKNAEMREWDDL